jgi:hypothetical protein
MAKRPSFTSLIERVLRALAARLRLGGARPILAPAFQHTPRRPRAIL